MQLEINENSLRYIKVCTEGVLIVCEGASMSNWLQLLKVTVVFPENDTEV